MAPKWEDQKKAAWRFQPVSSKVDSKMNGKSISVASWGNLGLP